MAGFGYVFEILFFHILAVTLFVVVGASDSVINYTPVSGCVAGAGRKPVFSWAVHAHHVLTLVLCLLGPNLPAKAVSIVHITMHCTLRR